MTHAPDHAQALFYRLKAFQTLDQTDKVEADWERLLAINAADIETVYFIGQANILINDDDYTDYGAFIHLTPHTAQEYYYRAYFHIQLDNLEAAMADYAEAITRLPYFIDAYFERAVLRKYEFGETDAALADFARVLEINPSHVYAHLNRAYIFLEQGDQRSAEAEYAAAIAVNPAIGYRSRGSYRERNLDLRGAIDDYSQAIAYAPEDASLYYDRGTAHQRQGDYDRAVADYEAIIRIRTTQPDNIFPSLSTVYQALVNLYRETEDFAAAEDYASRSIAANPEESHKYLQRAWIRYEGQNYDGAIADYSHFIEQCESRYHQDSLNLSTNEIPHFGSTLLASAYNGRAQTFFELSQYDEALEDVNRAIANASEHTLAFLYGLRSRIYEKLGEEDAAKRDREQADQLNEGASTGVQMIVRGC